MIDALIADDPTLHDEFETAKRHADAISHFVRWSGRYPLCGRGRINTYAIFAELMRNLARPSGRVGCIVPTGVATDDTTKHFFQDLVERQSLVSLYSFENEEKVFASVHNQMKFCLLTLAGAGSTVSQAEFVFFARRAEHISDAARRFTLNADEIALLNPNTRTCPIFRSARDADLTKAIYRSLPVLLREGDLDGNPWGLTFRQGLFNMTSDSHLFQTRQQLEMDGFALHGNIFDRRGDRWLPLYEAKMVHHFDHRYGDYAMKRADYGKSDLPEVPLELLGDPAYVPMPRYWVAEAQVRLRLATRWNRDWLLGWRDVTNTVNERTVIFTVLPCVGVGHTFPLMLTDRLPSPSSALVAVFDSLVLDDVARQKVGGMHLTYSFLMQLPVPTPAMLHAQLRLLIPRVLELVYTATDLAGFARDLGYNGPPFRWNPERRAVIRGELDAAIFRLYGIDRTSVDYIVDTFPLVRRKDEQQFNEYRTKRLILERYDAMAEADAARLQYQTPLDPPPGDPRAAGASPSLAVG